MNRFAPGFILGLIIAILIASPIAIPLGAQTGSIRLEGVVRDPSGNPLPNAVLTAVEESAPKIPPTKLFAVKVAIPYGRKKSWQ